MGLILVQFWSVTIMTDFAENLRKFRKIKKYSQAELGRKLNPSDMDVEQWIVSMKAAEMNLLFVI